MRHSPRSRPERLLHLVALRALSRTAAMPQPEGCTDVPGWIFGVILVEGCIFHSFCKISWECSLEQKYQCVIENEIQITKMRYFTEPQTFNLFWEKPPRLIQLGKKTVTALVSSIIRMGISRYYIINDWMTPLMMILFEQKFTTQKAFQHSTSHPLFRKVNKKCLKSGAGSLPGNIMHTLCCDGHYSLGYSRNRGTPVQTVDSRTIWRIVWRKGRLVFHWPWMGVWTAICPSLKGS